jgi:putative transposase
VHRSVSELEHAIVSFIEQHNGKPAPFSWARSADDILATIARFCTRTIAASQAS